MERKHEASLRYVVLYRGKQRILASVRDDVRNIVRHIRVEWKEKDATDTPPDNWTRSLWGELEFQRGEDAKGSRSFREWASS